MNTDWAALSIQSNGVGTGDWLTLNLLTLYDGGLLREIGGSKERDR